MARQVSREGYIYVRMVSFFFGGSGKCVGWDKMTSFQLRLSFSLSSLVVETVFKRTISG